MKFATVSIIVILLAVGAFFGFKVGQRNTTSNLKTNLSQHATANSQVLNLDNKGLTRVASDIYSKTNTTALILSNNSINTLPSEMGRMNQLVIFKIDHNLLDGSLIGEIRQMSQLKNLDVSFNKMTGMPAEIGQLSNLETLNYSYNNISGIPDELSHLKNNLKEINLTGNPLSRSSIAKLKSSLPNTTVIF